MDYTGAGTGVVAAGGAATLASTGFDASLPMTLVIALLVLGAVMVFFAVSRNRRDAKVASVSDGGSLISSSDS